MEVGIEGQTKDFVEGSTKQCLKSVGGDYFDVFPLGENRNCFFDRRRFRQRLGRCAADHDAARRFSPA